MVVASCFRDPFWFCTNQLLTFVHSTIRIIHGGFHFPYIIIQEEVLIRDNTFRTLLSWDVDGQSELMSTVSIARNIKLL